MQSTAMLMRSSSTPLLEGLLAPLSHSEPSLDMKNEGSFLTSGEVHAHLCVSLHTNRGGSAHLPASSHSHMHLDATPSKLLGWKSSSESPIVTLPPSTCMRKVQSENDLCNLGGDAGGVTPAARVAANTLLQDSLVDDFTPGSAFEYNNSIYYLPHGKKGRALMPLSRRGSLGSLPSELPSVFCNGDSSGNDFAILEEGESFPSSSVVASDDELDREFETSILDKIAFSVGEPVHSKHEGGVLPSNVHDESKSSMNLFENDFLHGTTDGQSAVLSPTTHDRIDMVASSSGRQKPDLELMQSPYVCVAGPVRNGMVATLATGECEPSFPLKCVYDGDILETAYNGSGGGRGARPPTTTGGGRGGGGGDAGGHGGGSPDVADHHYQQVLQKDPGNPLLLRNYAQYLADVKHDYRKAEEFFQRAILASPSDGELLGQYAKMLWEVKHDTDRATAYFERAVQAAPDNSYVMAAYASFLWSLDEEEQETTESSPSDFPASFPSLVSVGLA